MMNCAIGLELQSNHYIDTPADLAQRNNALKEKLNNLARLLFVPTTLSTSSLFKLSMSMGFISMEDLAKKVQEADDTNHPQDDQSKLLALFRNHSEY